MLLKFHPLFLRSNFVLTSLCVEMLNATCDEMRARVKMLIFCPADNLITKYCFLTQVVIMKTRIVKVCGGSLMFLVTRKYQ